MMDLTAVGQQMIVNGSAVPGDTVCVVNSAWFVLGFYFDDLVTGQECPEISSYPIDQTQCYSISDKLSSASPGDLVMVEVHAHAGETLAADSAVVYTPGAATVTFDCHGTTLNFDCKLLGESTSAVADYISQTKF